MKTQTKQQDLIWWHSRAILHLKVLVDFEAQQLSNKQSL